MPVVMISSLTDRGADATLTALEIGAVDYVSKPKLDLRHGLEELALTIAEKVKGAASARVTPSPERGPASVGTRSARSITSLGTTDRLIAIGSSTGGTEAVAQLLSQCPPDAPGIVIAQHIPEVFSQRWAVRMDRESAIVVAEAKDGDQILIGHAYVAPGGRHLRVERSGAKYFCRIGDDAPVNRHRPSVDVLFHSVAEQVGRNAVGVILTGMGADGADGLLQMSRAGCPTVAQDRESSVVWGMPGEAVKRGAVSEVVPLGVMTKRLLDLARAP
jgi:two-component system chemotaxis response regulator CheB